MPWSSLEDECHTDALLFMGADIGPRWLGFAFPRMLQIANFILYLTGLKRCRYFIKLLKLSSRQRPHVIALRCIELAIESILASLTSNLAQQKESAWVNVFCWNIHTLDQPPAWIKREEERSGCCQQAWKCFRKKERKKKIADGIFMAVFFFPDVFFTEVQERKKKIMEDFTHCTALFPFPLDGLWQELRRRRSFLMSRRSKSDGPSWIVRIQVLTSISHCALSGLSSTWTPETSSSDLPQPTRVSPKVHWDSEKIVVRCFSCA